MNMVASLPSDRPARRGQRDIAIWDLLIWAFQRELASIDFDDLSSEAASFVPAYGTEYLMMQQARLGCRVDGGGRSDCHPDADLVAAALATLPEGCGGRRMAVQIAELARVGRMPDWDIETAIYPSATARNQHSVQAKTIDSAEFGPNGWPNVQRRGRKGNIVTDKVMCCPVDIRGGPAEKARAQRNYLGWWGALLHLRSTFQIRPDLTSWCVTDAMPPRVPWQKSVDESCPPLS